MCVLVVVGALAFSEKCPREEPCARLIDSFGAVVPAAIRLSLIVTMPRFVAIRDCLGFHAAHEGVVGAVGDLGERELNQLVHFYPGSVYKASFVTADDAIQWLWSEMYNRPADQDLRSKQFQSDARLFPQSVASGVSGSDSSGQLNVAYWKKFLRHS